MGEQNKLVDVIIPTRNESKNIARVIGEVVKASPSYNVIVVDDSEDNHQTRVLAMMSGAKVIAGHHKGLGQAILDGLKASNADVAVVMDADLSHPPAKIPALVAACSNGCNMAIGSRYVSGGSIVGWTFKRKLISLVASALAYPITRMRDNTSGFFALSKSLVRDVELKPESWKIMLEILVKAKAKAVEIPIEFRDRQAGKSKFNKREVFAYLSHLVKLALWKWRMINFMLVGGVGYIINMAVYYPLTLWFQQTVRFFGQEFYLPPFVISSYIAITSNYLLNRASTFRGYKVKRMSYLKYLFTCSASLPVEMVLIYFLVHYLGFIPVVAVAVAILIVFIARFLVVSKVVWTKNQNTVS